MYVKKNPTLHNSNSQLHFTHVIQSQDFRIMQCCIDWTDHLTWNQKLKSYLTNTTLNKPWVFSFTLSCCKYGVFLYTLSYKFVHLLLKEIMACFSRHGCIANLARIVQSLLPLQVPSTLSSNEMTNKQNTVILYYSDMNKLCFNINITHCHTLNLLFSHLDCHTVLITVSWLGC